MIYTYQVNPLNTKINIGMLDVTTLTWLGWACVLGSVSVAGPAVGFGNGMESQESLESWKAHKLWKAVYAEFVILLLFFINNTHIMSSMNIIHIICFFYKKAFTYKH